MDKAHTLTDKEIKRLQSSLEPIYRSAEKWLRSEIEKWLEYVAKDIEKLKTGIESAETDAERAAAENAYKLFFVKASKKNKEFLKMQKDAATHLYVENLKAAREINKRTPKTYAENYNAIGHELQSELEGYEFIEVSEETAKKFGRITQQTVDRRKDEAWNRKNIANAVIAGSLLLYGADKIAQKAASLTAKKNQDGAFRQASDMLTDAENKGRLDSMYRAYDEGFEDVQKEWVCVFDNRTRESHRRYNDIGPVELEYEYASGLRRPRDPDCPDPDEVCRCRCALATSFGRSMGKTRAARVGTVTGTYQKPSSFKGTYTEQVERMTYEEWMSWRESR